MKFRTDFVTNSSSSCYVVSYTVEGIPFQPLPDDYMGECSVSYADVPIDEVIEKIKNGASVDDIATMIAESTRNYDCLYHMFTGDLGKKIMHSDVSYEETLERISTGEFEGVEEGDAERAKDYLERIRCFRKAMSRLSSASEIEEIVETVTYTGWGEFLSDSIQDFIDTLDSDTLELAGELLDDEWWEGIEEATTATHYNVTDGTSYTTKQIQGFDFTRDSILDMYWEHLDDCDAEDLEDEMPKLEYIAEEVEGESYIPEIVDILLSKGIAEYAEEFLNDMKKIGGKHAEIAESLSAKIEGTKKEENSGQTL